MAWFGDGLSSLSNLKGQITSFTKEVLSEGIVEETDPRTRELNEANERCVQLQEVLNSKDIEISLLRRQNCELQKAVVEFNARPRETNDGKGLDDEGGGDFFWDPPPVKNPDVTKNPERISLLQERLSQATVRIGELENELKLLRASTSERRDETNDGHRKAEFLRAKQDMVNRIIQIGEKGRDAERNLKKLPLDESALINDFRAALTRLDSHEQSRMIENALRALNDQRDDSRLGEDIEKFDVHEKHEKFVRPRLESISLISHNDEIDIGNVIAENGNSETGNNREMENLRRRIEELQRENEFLTTSLDELDKEHAQSLETVLVMKDELVKKHESLKNAYEQLYVECNEAQTKLQFLENRSSNVSIIEANNNNSITENLTCKKPTKSPSIDKEIQTELSASETSPVNSRNVEISCNDDTEIRKIENSMKIPIFQTTMTRNIDEESQTEIGNSDAEQRESEIVADLTRRVGDILKNFHIPQRDNETLLVTLAKEYRDEVCKREILEKKFNDLSRESRETADTRDSLRNDCYEMQTNIESLLMQIEHLKSSLPSIPEASEERVASLETETETMSQEIGELVAEREALRTRNNELVRATRVLEASLRNQENLEAEVRNTRRLLNLANQRPCDDSSKIIDSSEIQLDDSNLRLSACLVENDELRSKINNLEISMRRDANERASEKSDFQKTIESRDIEIRDLVSEFAKSRQIIENLENEIVRVNEARNELELDIEALSAEKENLDAELAVLRENSSEKMTSDALAKLRDKLEASNRERNDLNYDLMNMRNELDACLVKYSNLEIGASELGDENARLGRENGELFEQSSANEKESSERIELLQTEINLLSQEYAQLKSVFSLEKRRIDDYRAKLEESEEKRDRLERELSLASAKLEARTVDHENLTILRQKISSLEEAARSREKELTKLRDDEKDMKLPEERCANLEKISDEAMMLEKRFGEMEKRCDELEKIVACREMENNNLRESSDVAKKLIAELRESIVEHESTLRRVDENSSMAKETIETLSRLVGEKDREIVNLKSTIDADAARKLDEKENSLESLKNEREEFVRLVQDKHNTNLQYYAEIQRLVKLLDEQTTNIQRMRAEIDEKTLKLSEKETEILWSRNELEVVRKRLKSLEESQNFHEACNIVEHSRQIGQAALINEKCNALEAALIKEQSSNRIMQNQLDESQSRETNAARELERLRTHLMEIEASYTEEALIAEENRKKLESKLLQAEEKAQNSSTVYTSASIRANQQVETLQQQMSLIVQQRDEIQAKLSAAEDKVLSHTASLTNLQIVLEQFQRDKENDIRSATEKLRQQLGISYKEQEDLRNEIVNLRTQLCEAKECLQAASRLSEQLDKKSERINELNQEVARLGELVNTADQRIQEARSSEEGKVDKNLVKNLLLGFLNSSTMDKSSVLRVFATVLEFDESERDKIGLNHPAANGGWFSGLLGSGGASTPNKDQEASLSAAFVRFLENESKPKPQLPALTISNSSLSRPGHSRQHSSSSTQSGLLLSGVTLPSFPDFVPSRNTGSILKEVLKDS